MKFLRKLFSKEWIWRLFLTLQISGIILLIWLELTTTWELSDILDSKQYRRGQFGHIEENLMALGYLFFPFAISSIPASFIGGYISIDSDIYKIILGLFLIIAVLRILLIKTEENLSLRKNNKKLSFIIGFIIGFVSGLIGIGGGIILSPIIVLLKWGTLKQTAAVSALFIFVNSISGFMGYLINGNILPSKYLILIPIVLFGGILGSLYGSFFSSNRILSYLLAFVLIIASSKLLFL